MENDIYEWYSVLKYFMSQIPYLPTVLEVLGSVVFIATVVDAVIPDKYDKGFTKYLMKIPILSGLIKALIRFSPLNYKDKIKK